MHPTQTAPIIMLEHRKRQLYSSNFLRGPYIFPFFLRNFFFSNNLLVFQRFVSFWITEKHQVEPPDRAEIGRAAWRYLHALAAQHPERPRTSEAAAAQDSPVGRAAGETGEFLVGFFGCFWLIIIWDGLFGDELFWYFGFLVGFLG